MTEINAYIKVVGLLGDTGQHRLTRVHLTKTVAEGSVRIYYCGFQIVSRRVIFTMAESK